MAIISTLLSVSEPSGVWISIIKAFEAVTNNYVLAVIFLTVVIRVAWGIVETVSKYSQQKMNALNAKIQPEMDKLKAKYENQPDVLKQKQNELYRRNGKGQYSGCIVMIVVMALNLFIFFTLFSGLNTMASYKISKNYDNLKYTYANCLNVTDKYLENNSNAIFENYENLKYVITEEEGVKYISLIQQEEGQEDNILLKIEYKDDFSYEIEENEETVTVDSNKYILQLVQKYFPTYEEGEEIGSKEVILKQTPILDENNNPVLDENDQPTYNKLYLSSAIQNVAIKLVGEVYEENKDSFLWINNIWVADSPMQDSIVGFNSVKGHLRNIDTDEEKIIYNSFMIDLKLEKNTKNGYMIFPILCILTSLLTTYVTTLYNKIKNKKKGLPTVKQTNGKFMQLFIPLLFGMFALFYNSVFAIYMFIGQVVSIIITPLQLLVIDKIIDKQKQKEEVVVDYSRNF